MELIDKNGLVFAFLIVGSLMLLSSFLAKWLKLPAVVLAILMGLGLAFLGGEKGISDYPLFAGMAILGGSMFRDFTVVATALGVDISKIKHAGKSGILALFSGVCYAFFSGVFLAFLMGYRDPVELCTLGAGACTYIVGPVTGTALGAGNDIIALSVAIGVLKTIVTTIGTPLLAKNFQINTPKAAMVFGGLLGTSSGVTAGLAATDPKLVPYGALTATFYTGLGCLLCPSVFYLVVNWLF